MRRITFLKTHETGPEIRLKTLSDTAIPASRSDTIRLRTGSAAHSIAIAVSAWRHARLAILPVSDERTSRMVDRY
ncbi:MAG: hypothetical protein ACYDEV_09075 [Acidiferrobacter sp.]